MLDFLSADSTISELQATILDFVSGIQQTFRHNRSLCVTKIVYEFSMNMSTQ